MDDQLWDIARVADRLAKAAPTVALAGIPVRSRVDAEHALAAIEADLRRRSLHTMLPGSWAERCTWRSSGPSRRLLGKISAEVGLPRLTAHGLRHTSATLMLARGVPPKVAAERLGHADPTLFTNLYSHVTPAMQKEAAAQIGDALFGEN